MNQCSYCGSMLSQNILCCPHCGASLKDKAEEAPKFGQKRRWIAGVLLAAALVVLCAPGIVKHTAAYLASLKAQRQQELFLESALAADSRDAESLHKPVLYAPALAYVPPFVNSFLSEPRDANAYLAFAETLHNAGYESDALRVLSTGYKRLADKALKNRIREYWPRPADVSETFSYFNPVARIMGKTWDTFTWEDAEKIKYLCIARGYMAISFEEYEEYHYFPDYLGTIWYAGITEQDVMGTTGFRWNREAIAANAKAISDDVYVQAEEYRSAAIGVFSNVTFLQLEDHSFVPTCLIASLPRLRILYATDYMDYSRHSDGKAGDVYAPLQSLDDLTTLRGNVPMTDSGLPQVTEIELSTTSEYTGAYQYETAFVNGKPLWTPGKTGWNQGEHVLFTARKKPDSVNLTSLYHFPSLTSLLLLHQTDGCDLSALEQLPQLEKLEIRDCHSIDNLESIGTLPALRELTIKDMPSVANFGFIDGMQSLESLTLYTSKIGRAPDLQTLPHLKILFSNVLYGDDITVLPELESVTAVGLTSLSILEGNHPTTLIYESPYTLHGLDTLKSLTYLHLSGNLSGYLPDISGLTNVKTLILTEVSPAHAAKVIKGLENLELVSIQNINAADGLEELFDVLSTKTSVKKLLIVPTRQNLSTATKYIFGERVDLSDLHDDEPDRLRLNARPYLEKLRPLTNLQQLRMESCNIKTLDFVSDMKNLKSLNVCDNVVTDVSAIANLPKLEHLDLKLNPVEQSKVEKALEKNSFVGVKMSWPED